MGTTTQDPELIAKERIRKMLDKLKPEIREEVVAWVVRRYYQEDGTHLEELRP